MKKINYILFAVVTLFTYISCVCASCTDEELNLLKKETDKIKITYKYLEEVTDEEGNVYYDMFELNIKNVNDDFYLFFDVHTEKLNPSNNNIKLWVRNGNFNFKVYSNKCEEKITDLEFFIPRFNPYSKDELCEGIDGNDFPLCGKYYEYDVDYEDFVTRVNHYRSNHKITNDVTDDEELIKENNAIFETILNFINQYQIYIIVVLFLILLILVMLIIAKRRRDSVILK